MPKCPNCGQETMRTEDWACQFCGYPLLSSGYKKIDKTWKQLQEERGEGKLNLPPQEFEDTPPPVPGSKPGTKPAPSQRPPREPEPVVEVEEELPPPVIRPQNRPKPVPQPEPEVEYEPPPPVVRPKNTLQPAPQPEPETEDEPPPQPVARYEPPSVPAPVPEHVSVPPPKPIVQPASNPVVETALELSADDLLSAYMLNDTAAHEKFTNKILRVTGVVGKVTVNDMRAVYSVFLTSPQLEGFRDVECRFSRQYAAIINQLKPGQSVTVQGRYFGYVINVIMRACTLVN